MSSSYNKSKGRSDTPGGFAGIPRIVMKTTSYKALNGGSVKLLIELASQYRGKNNGDLTVAFSILKERGFNSKSAITRAVEELISAKLILRTRDGVFMNPGGRCALYAITWLSIDECKGKQLSVGETRTSPRKFSLEVNEKPRPQHGLGSSLKQGRHRVRDANGQFSSTLKKVRLKAIA